MRIPNNICVDFLADTILLHGSFSRIETFFSIPLLKPQRTQAASSAGDADAVVRWDFCRLDFFGTFFVKKKSTGKFLCRQSTESILFFIFSHLVINQNNFYDLTIKY